MHTHIHKLQLVYMDKHTYIPSPFNVVDTVKSHNHFALFIQRIMNTIPKTHMRGDFIVAWQIIEGYRGSQ